MGNPVGIWKDDGKYYWPKPEDKNIWIKGPNNCKLCGKNLTKPEIKRGICGECTAIEIYKKAEILDGSDIVKERIKQLEKDEKVLEKSVKELTKTRDILKKEVQALAAHIAAVDALEGSAEILESMRELVKSLDQLQ